MREQNLAVKARFHQAVQAGDWEAAAACMHPDFALEEPSYLPYGGRYPGVEGMQRALKAIGGVVRNAHETTHTYFAEDPDRLICELQVNGRVLASGAEVETTVLEFWQFRDGKILRIAPYWFNASAFDR